MTDQLERPAPFLQLLREGIAQTLANNVNARERLAWQPEGRYPADEFGIYSRRWPAIDSPSLTIADYTVADGTTSDDQVGIQFTIKHRDQRGIDRVESDLFELFHESPARDLTSALGTVRLVIATRASGTDIGQDSNGRQGRYESYTFTVHRPTPNRS